MKNINLTRIAQYASDRLDHVEHALKARTLSERWVHMALADLASDSMAYRKGINRSR